MAPRDPFGSHLGEVNLAKSSVYLPIRAELLSEKRQGWPSSHRTVGGSSSPSVRRSRNRFASRQPFHQGSLIFSKYKPTHTS